MTETMGLKALFEEAIVGKKTDSIIRCFDEYQQALLMSFEYLGLSKAYLDLIEYLYLCDLHEKAIFYSVKYIRLMDRDQVPPVAIYYAMAATLEYMQENYIAALAYTKKELEFYNSDIYSRERANCYSNLGVLELTLGNYNNALNYLVDSKMLLQELQIFNKQDGKGTKVNLARVYIELGELDKAKRYLEELLNLQDIDLYTMLKVELYTNWGHWHLAENRYEEAITYFEEAIELAELKAMRFELRQLYKRIADTYESLNDYKRSNDYLKKYSDLANIMALEIQKYIRMKAEAENSLLEKEKAVQKTKGRLLQRVREVAYDILTNTYSKVYMNDYLKKLMSSDSDCSQFSLMVVNIAGLDQVEKSLGFRAVEQLLVDISSAFVSKAGDHQTIGRIGYSKFLISCEEEPISSSKEQGTKMLAGLRATTVATLGQAEVVELRAGIVSFPNSGAKDPESLIRMAELALYQAMQNKDLQPVQW